MTNSFTQRLEILWNSARYAVTRPPVQIKIDENRIFPPMKSSSEFRPGDHYFQVRLNQMFLQYEREWLRRFDPMALVITEFIYGNDFVAIPYLVGPSIFENRGIQVPNGLVIADTRVAGLYPYRGDRVIIRVILYKNQRETIITQFTNLLESVTNAFDFASSLSGYLTVANILVSGVEYLLQLGQTQPVLAFSKEIDPHAGDQLRSSYYAIIDRPHEDIRQEHIWVSDNNLFWGTNPDNWRKYSDSDFILFSLVSSDWRDDVERLSFHWLWTQALKHALVPDENSWKLAKSTLLTLYQNMVLSPDLTQNQAAKLKESFIHQLRLAHSEAIELAVLGDIDTDKNATLDPKTTLEILNME